MPTYEYLCESCGHRFERFQSMTEKPVDLCPQCKGGVRRLIGAGGGVIFKGKGFYATDYKNKKEPQKKCPIADQAKPECGSCGKI